jgi:hypothetical protein
MSLQAVSGICFHPWQITMSFSMTTGDKPLPSPCSLWRTPLWQMIGAAANETPLPYHFFSTQTTQMHDWHFCDNPKDYTTQWMIRSDRFITTMIMVPCHFQSFLSLAGSVRVKLDSNSDRLSISGRFFWLFDFESSFPLSFSFFLLRPLTFYSSLSTCP